jgi:hypothetical protein
VFGNNHVSLLGCRTLKKEQGDRDIFWGQWCSSNNKWKNNNIVLFQTIIPDYYQSRAVFKR